MEKNIKFFKDNLDSWLTDDLYRHKHVVIADQKVRGVFDDFPKALDYASSNLNLGEFVIQQVIGEDEQIGFLQSAFPVISLVCPSRG